MVRNGGKESLRLTIPVKTAGFHDVWIRTHGWACSCSHRTSQNETREWGPMWSDNEIPGSHGYFLFLQTSTHTFLLLFRKISNMNLQNISLLRNPTLWGFYRYTYTIATENSYRPGEVHKIPDCVHAASPPAHNATFRNSRIAPTEPYSENLTPDPNWKSKQCTILGTGGLLISTWSREEPRSWPLYEMWSEYLEWPESPMPRS